jgi:D-beta-D-heptose 7-phosphate kinase/D-beta-D-heptose 1-phosphate adenosyltransferase
VIGEICLDRFIYCSSSRLSPEAPVPVVKPVEIIENPGMAGNVTKNLEALSKEVDIFSLHQEDLITKTRYVDKKSNHMFLRIDEGENNPCKTLENLPDLSTFDLVIVSDYNKGFLNSQILELIARSSKISILDTKKKLDQQLASLFTFIKLNDSERDINKHLDDNNLIITLGSRGSRYRGVIFPQKNPLETIDVSGAGDTFLASFSIEYLKTGDVISSIGFANEMSALVVSKKGVATP